MVPARFKGEFFGYKRGRTWELMEMIGAYSASSIGEGSGGTLGDWLQGHWICKLVLPVSRIQFR